MEVQYKGGFLTWDVMERRMRPPTPYDCFVDELLIADHDGIVKRVDELRKEVLQAIGDADADN